MVTVGYRDVSKYIYNAIGSRLAQCRVVDSLPTYMPPIISATIII